MSAQIQGRYFGKGAPLFKLYFITAIFTVLTLGIYRFWAKTRIRKYIWSSVTGDDDSFEYTGTGLEKFLGFLVAIVILAIYLGVVQLLLTFIGFSIVPQDDSPEAFAGQAIAINLSIFAVLPLMLFAQYRARRYKMARSRWRGIRFGMENGAWGYVARALGYGFLTMITLGILAPLGTYRLEKYMADRSWYGDGRFDQGGRWQDLYKGMKHVFIGLVLMIVSGVLFGMGAANEQVALAILGGIGIFVAYIWLLIGLVYYRVYAFCYLTGKKVLDGQITFSAQVETSTIIAKIIVGGIVISVLMGVIFAVIAGVGAAVFAGAGATGQLGAGSIVGVVIIAILYALALLAAGGLSLVMITQPIIEHVVNNVTVHNADHLDTIQQRSADSFADADGFADALDVGGAI
ncbi:DUF898 family protein [uncultured Tateyamaria sp.]|uniref:YjgN family protein n=1 Tax=Tateyamaria sp. 1078 TaxID=3417464 RepID=UPI00260E2FE2|nr:DUF898 family protein [uncultured Tateyamaria sp.]